MATTANGKGPILPSPETVNDGTYRPLSRPIFIYPKVKALGRPEVQSFIEFYLTKGAALVREVGYIPLADQEYELVRQRFAAQEDRLDVPGHRQPQPGDAASSVSPSSPTAAMRDLCAERSSSSASSGRSSCARPALILVTLGIVLVLLFETVAFLREVPRRRVPVRHGLDAALLREALRRPAAGGRHAADVGRSPWSSRCRPAC